MRHLLPLALLTLTTACGTYVQQPTRLARQEYARTLRFEKFSLHPTLSAHEMGQLDSLAAALPKEATPRFVIRTGDAAMDGSEKMQELISVLRERWPGVAPAEIRAGKPSDRVTLDAVYIAFADPDPCPDWRGAGLLNQEDSLAHHIGCATATNFHLQVANPDDLLMGRSRPQPDTVSATRAVERHYSGEILQQHLTMQQNTTPNQTTGE
jgi:type IV pilus biogenesis protein CpaD/CtpE